jgi:hypothetical protein
MQSPGQGKKDEGSTVTFGQPGREAEDEECSTVQDDQVVRLEEDEFVLGRQSALASSSMRSEAQHRLERSSQQQLDPVTGCHAA